MASDVVDIQTTVSITGWHAKADDVSQLCRLFINKEPNPGAKRVCEIYSDDGKGNGTLIMCFDLE